MSKTWRITRSLSLISELSWLGRKADGERKRTYGERKRADGERKRKSDRLQKLHSMRLHVEQHLMNT